MHPNLIINYLLVLCCLSSTPFAYHEDYSVSHRNIESVELMNLAKKDGHNYNRRKRPKVAKKFTLENGETTMYLLRVSFIHI